MLPIKKERVINAAMMPRVYERSGTLRSAGEIVSLGGEIDAVSEETGIVPLSYGTVGEIIGFVQQTVL